MQSTDSFLGALSISLVEILTNEPVQGPGDKNIFAPFFAAEQPSIAVPDYLQRLMHYAPVSDELLVVTLAYVDKLISRAGGLLRLSFLSVHRLLLSCLLVAIKFYSDAFYSNDYLANVGGVPTRELNALERSVLRALDFDLVVRTEHFRYLYVCIVNRVPLRMPLKYPARTSYGWSLEQVEAHLAHQSELDLRVRSPRVLPSAATPAQPHPQVVVPTHPTSPVNLQQRAGSAQQAAPTLPASSGAPQLAHHHLTQSVSGSHIPLSVASPSSLSSFALGQDRRSASYVASRPYESPKPIFGRIGAGPWLANTSNNNTNNHTDSATRAVSGAVVSPAEPQLPAVVDLQHDGVSATGNPSPSTAAVIRSSSATIHIHSRNHEPRSTPNRLHSTESIHAQHSQHAHYHHHHQQHQQHQQHHTPRDDGVPPRSRDLSSSPPHSSDPHLAPQTTVSPRALGSFTEDAGAGHMALGSTPHGPRSFLNGESGSPLAEAVPALSSSPFRDAVAYGSGASQQSMSSPNFYYRPDAVPTQVLSITGTSGAFISDDGASSSSELIFGSPTPAGIFGTGGGAFYGIGGSGGQINYPTSAGGVIGGFGGGLGGVFGGNALGGNGSGFGAGSPASPSPSSNENVYRSYSHPNLRFRSMAAQLSSPSLPTVEGPNLTLSGQYLRPNGEDYDDEAESEEDDVLPSAQALHNPFGNTTVLQQHLRNRFAYAYEYPESSAGDEVSEGAYSDVPDLNDFSKRRSGLRFERDERTGSLAEGRIERSRVGNIAMGAMYTGRSASSGRPDPRVIEDLPQDFIQGRGMDFTHNNYYDYRNSGGTTSPSPSTRAGGAPQANRSPIISSKSATQPLSPTVASPSSSSRSYHSIESMSSSSSSETSTTSSTDSCASESTGTLSQSTPSSSSSLSRRNRHNIIHAPSLEEVSIGSDSMDLGRNSSPTPSYRQTGSLKRLSKRSETPIASTVPEYGATTGPHAVRAASAPRPTAASLQQRHHHFKGSLKRQDESAGQKRSGSIHDADLPSVASRQIATPSRRSSSRDSALMRPQPVHIIPSPSEILSEPLARQTEGVESALHSAAAPPASRHHHRHDKHRHRRKNRKQTQEDPQEGSGDGTVRKESPSFRASTSSQDHADSHSPGSFDVTRSFTVESLGIAQEAPQSSPDEGVI